MSEKTDFVKNWQEANQQCLMAGLSRVRTALEHYTAGTDPHIKATIVSESDNLASQNLDSPPYALDALCALFGLSPFERDVVLLCAGIELDAAFSALCASAQGETRQNYPTFSLALAALSEVHWSALSPDRPLRYWRLIELSRDDSLTQSPLRIDERVLHYLTGINHLDGRLRGFVEPILERTSPALHLAEDLVPSHQALVEKIISIWKGAFQGTARDQPLPVIQLCGREPMEYIAVAVCTELGFNLYSLRANTLPLDPRELEALLRLWEREAVFGGHVLLLNNGDYSAGEAAREEAIRYWLEKAHSPLMLISSERRASSRRLIVTLDIHKPTVSEQQTLWRTVLGDEATSMNGSLDRLAAQFNLSASVIRTVWAEVWNSDGNLHPAGEGASLEYRLWETCRKQARPQLGSLAMAIEPVATWNDLVLPDTQLQILREVAMHVRQRVKVYENWGFAARSSRGLGISALFVGTSGTGKTMAAEVLANELQLDLFRIDLSQVVSKYIGETEKNLSRVFDAAEAGGAILLFDEADALFGKRSEVKDSHDRYANIEISYLLQRMEAYRGLAILTTNMKSALDNAFLRRIQFVIQFPFPDVPQRAEIWRRIFPSKTPTAGLNPQKLAQLNVAGGNIRNIALYGAFLAAEADEPVQMDHLLRAARVEYAKLEKPLTAAESKDWRLEVDI